MKCPVCSVELNMMDRQGVEIDYCPQCRGVWLDRGELDKLIERSAPAARPDERRSGDYHPGDHRSSDHYYQPGQHHGGHDSYHRKHKRESFLGEIFDF